MSALAIELHVPKLYAYGSHVHPAFPGEWAQLIQRELRLEPVAPELGGALARPRTLARACYLGQYQAEPASVTVDG
jgi:hypothetical protein